jgi:hypothetical protein
MRVTISLLVSSLVFGSLALDYPGKANHTSRKMLSVDAQPLLWAQSKPKPKPNEPEDPTPHRGSGRRDLIESLHHAFVVC